MEQEEFRQVFYGQYVDKLGGPEKAELAEAQEKAERDARWNQDVELIGRILRAHLYVEHYLGVHIQFTNPHLGPLHDAKLGYMQKTHLLDRRDLIGDLIPGIRHLNAVRNRLAHRLSAVLTKDDRRIFLQHEAFVRQSSKDVDALSDIEVLEEFANFAASALNHVASPVQKAMFAAYKEAKLIAAAREEAPSGAERRMHDVGLLQNLNSAEDR